jgi:phenylpropionate dioxygenase-like ring-hydroxylating dioxygenase large terminal subunit
MNTTYQPPPPISKKIFNNPNIIAKGWYFACRSNEIPIGQAKSIDLCNQRIVLYRGTDQQIRALDAFCPHLGTDLGIGRIEGNHIRCFFHHWAFDDTGNCIEIPCQKAIPTQAKVRSYATTEKYGVIWIYPDRRAPNPIANFDELVNQPVTVSFDRPIQRGCHHHICMMNGIDAQHLRTVHGLPVKMDLDLQEDQQQGVIDFTMAGDVPGAGIKGQLMQRFLGKTYSYSMRYANGTMGLLTMMKQVKWLPPLHMIYAYRPLPAGRSEILPIYITAQRSGLFGWLKSQLLLLLTRLAYYFLRDEDGQIYDNIRFHPNAILEIDAPLVHYMNYVNQLQPSIWGQGNDVQN